jgi:hypothetical protein
MPFNSVVAAIAGTVTLVTLAASATPAAVNRNALKETARQFTVTLEGCSSGLGIIIDRQNKRYSLLTPSSQINAPQEPCWVKLPDGERQQLQSSPMDRQTVSFNLTVMKFNSDRDYEIAPLGKASSPKAGDIVYTVGISQESERFGVAPVKVSAQHDLQNYHLTYQSTNATAPRLSSGPILNEKGKVIGLQISDQTGIALPKSLATFLRSPRVTVADLQHQHSSQPQPSHQSGKTEATKKLENSHSEAPKDKKLARDRQKNESTSHSLQAAVREANSQSLEERKLAMSQSLLNASAVQKSRSQFPFELLLLGAGVCAAIALLYRL